jgi:hypothetical protein
MEAEVTVPSLPIYFSVPICGAALVLVLFQVWRLREPCVGFLLLAIWLRYSLAVFHAFTYPRIVFGWSIVALSSIIVVCIGLLVAGGRQILMRRLAPMYAMMLVVAVSAIINETSIGAVNVILKWLYLIVFALAAYTALRRHGSDRVFGALAVVFIGPIALQWVSVAWGLKSTNEEDGSSSFIGGYQHEQSFSIILLTFLVVTCFSQRIGVTTANGRLGLAATGLVLANYRTTLLAAALPAAALAVSKLTGKLVRKQRVIAVLFLGFVTIVVFVAIANLAHERFADIGTTIQKGASLIQPPEYFTTDERRLFSGRVYLWSQYLDAYSRGDIINILVGFGPEAWVGRFPLYAHNTFISYTYELGVFGLAAFTWVLIANFLIAVEAHRNGRLVLLSCHIGFLVLNLATMPMWTLEGDILYALILAQTWYLHAFRTVANERLSPVPTDGWMHPGKLASSSGDGHLRGGR